MKWNFVKRTAFDQTNRSIEMHVNIGTHSSAVFAITVCVLLNDQYCTCLITQACRVLSNFSVLFLINVQVRFIVNQSDVSFDQYVYRISAADRVYGGITDFFSLELKD